MHERASGHDLLETARQVLRNDVIPHLSGEQKLAALMIANAIGIAARQSAAGSAPARAERISLQRLIAQYAAHFPENMKHAAALRGIDDAETEPETDEAATVDAEAGAASSATLRALNRALADAIRQGVADPEPTNPEPDTEPVTEPDHEPDSEPDHEPGSSAVHPPSPRAAIYAHVRAVARQRVLESHPTYLEGAP